MEKEWSQMTKEEKRDKRMKDYIEGTGIKFRDAKAKKLYKERVTRAVKVSRCEQPDRVPVAVDSGGCHLHPFQVRRPRGDVLGWYESEKYIRLRQNGIKLRFSGIVSAELRHNQRRAVFNLYFGADGADTF